MVCQKKSAETRRAQTAHLRHLSPLHLFCQQMLVGVTGLEPTASTTPKFLTIYLQINRSFGAVFLFT